MWHWETWGPLNSHDKTTANLQAHVVWPSALIAKDLSKARNPAVAKCLFKSPNASLHLVHPEISRVSFPDFVQVLNLNLKYIYRSIGWFWWFFPSDEYYTYTSTSTTTTTTTIGRTQQFSLPKFQENSRQENKECYCTTKNAEFQWSNQGIIDAGW